MNMKAPFPYFGGKRSIAKIVWDRLGDPDNFIEPFSGSAAILLNRPHPPKLETINDADMFVANFWRSVSIDPDMTAAYADNPVNETDLHARHRWLVGVAEPEPIVPPEFSHPLLRRAYLAGYARQDGSASKAFRRRMKTDPNYYDAQIAGWWCWGLCCWIGSGWCANGNSATWEQKPSEDRGVNADINELASGKRPDLSTDKGVRNQVNPDVKRPTLSCNQGSNSVHVYLSSQRPQVDRQGVNSNVGLSVKRPQVDHQGVNNKVNTDEKRPHIGGFKGQTGQGINVMAPADTNRPQLADAHSRGRGVHSNDSASTCETRLAWLQGWFRGLQDRLRTVRVCCGDWSRVCLSDSVTTRLGTTGIFFDPPYGATSNRKMGLYGVDSGTVAQQVMAYCLERGTNPKMRICLAGYEGEGHEKLEAAGWKVVAWKAQGGYGNRNEKGNENAAKERLWFSPSCLDPETERMPLFSSLIYDDDEEEPE